MIVALESGKIDGYISEKPGAISATTSNDNLTFVEFDEGDGFETSVEDTSIAVGISKDNEKLLEDVNEALKDISQEEREKIMQEAVENQPLGE